MQRTTFSGNDLGRTQTSGWSFKFKYTEAMVEDCENSSRKDEIMQPFCNAITDNKSSSLRRLLICEASRMGHASELKARTQTCGRCSSSSGSSSSRSSRHFWQLMWLWSASLLTSPIWPLMIPAVPKMTLKFWNNRLPSHTPFQKFSLNGASSTTINAGLVA